MHISLLRLGVHLYISHYKFIHLYRINSVSSKWQITGNIKSFRHEVVSLTAKTFLRWFIKASKILIYNGTRKEIQFLNILDVKSLIAPVGIKLTKKRWCVYWPVVEEFKTIRLLSQFLLQCYKRCTVPQSMPEVIIWSLHPFTPFTT